MEPVSARAAPAPIAHRSGAEEHHPADDDQPPCGVRSPDVRCEQPEYVVRGGEPDEPAQSRAPVQGTLDEELDGGAPARYRAHLAGVVRRAAEWVEVVGHAVQHGMAVEVGDGDARVVLT